MKYQEAKLAHTENIYEKFNIDPTFLFLNQFMKAGNKELQHSFLEFLQITLKTGMKSQEKFEHVYNYVQSNGLLDNIIQYIISHRIQAKWYSDFETRQHLQELSTLPLSQDEFSPSSSIDKQLFAKVQKSKNISDLSQIIITMNEMMSKKIYWTYYNTQTNRIIEDIFNINDRIIPTLVDIKGVDFFIDKIPIDLKITRIPKEFDERFDKLQLIKWLYENQSEQRFGSENRLFLILNDKNNPNNTDRLKVTHYNDIKRTINDYLSTYNSSNLNDIHFIFQNKHYNAKSDLIFVNI